MKIKEIMHVVERYLQDHPHLRDNDNKLIASVWRNDLKINSDSPLRAIDFLELVATGKVVNPQSITRARRKLQELIPEYRGDKYKERMAQEKKVRSEIKNM